MAYDEAQARPMDDSEYIATKAHVLELIDQLRKLDAWRFKHEAKRRGERAFGQWVWALHLEARQV